MKDGLNISIDGHKEWYKNDRLHREDGPAIEYCSGYYSGYKAWFLNGKRHRIDGPAIKNGEYDSYYVNGKPFGNSPSGMTQEKFLRLMKLKAFL